MVCGLLFGTAAAAFDAVKVAIAPRIVVLEKISSLMK
jgi:hypothetical protein